jgi:hypothetical protein
MFDAIKPLLDSGLINEDVRKSLEEAWQSKLADAREQTKSEIREEMAQRYEHDKAVMMEALDQLLTDSLTQHVARLVEERKTLAKDRVRFNSRMLEKASEFDEMLESRLRVELKELYEDRKAKNKAIAKLDKFVTESVRKELLEFAEDKAELTKARVALVTENKTKMTKLRENFIKKSAELVERTVETTLRSELSQLKEDIVESKKNDFGRKIFEAFATEYSATHLNERAEVKKLTNTIAGLQSSLEEAKTVATQAKASVSQKEAQIKRINETNERINTINNLLKPLSKDKAEVMRELLESVPTSRLKDAFKKYLNPVMEGKTFRAKSTIVESRTVTGNKSAAVDTNIIEINDIKRLAGLTK